MQNISLNPKLVAIQTVLLDEKKKVFSFLFFFEVVYHKSNYGAKSKALHWLLREKKQLILGTTENKNNAMQVQETQQPTSKDSTLLIFEDEMG